MDLFREIEKNLRSYPERLPIDDFLPPPEDLPSALPAETGFTGHRSEEPSNPRRATSRSVPTDRKPVPPSPGQAENPVSDNLDAEIREFIEQQKDRGKHNSSEWIQESPPAAGKKEPGGSGEGPHSGS